jgi:hypothetical protein
LAHIAFAVDDVEAARAAVLEAGGGVVGEVVTLDVAQAGKVTFVYVTDPEGNIIELQKWPPSPRKMVEEHDEDEEDIGEDDFDDEDDLTEDDSSGLPQYPIGTVALYGPDDKTTTKIVAGDILYDGAEPILNRWVATNVMEDPKVQREMNRFFKKHGVKSVGLSSGCRRVRHVMVRGIRSTWTR